MVMALVFLAKCQWLNAKGWFPGQLPVAGFNHVHVLSDPLLVNADMSIYRNQANSRSSSCAEAFFKSVLSD
jgi:hypothetical protein